MYKQLLSTLAAVVTLCTPLSLPATAQGDLYQKTFDLVVAKHLTVELGEIEKIARPQVLPTPRTVTPDERRPVRDPTTAFCPNSACPARGQSSKGNISVHSQ